MKVDQLYIIGIQMDEEDQDAETKVGLDGLTMLYGNSSSERKAAHVDKVFVTISDQKLLHQGDLKELRDAEGKALPKSDVSRVGIYVYNCIIGCSLTQKPFPGPFLKKVIDYQKTKAIEPFAYEFCEGWKIP